MKIDFVLPWVDGNDQEWQQRKSFYSGKNDIKSNLDFRFRDFDTLKYVFRSIEKNCSWYNKIYLITEGHIPDWLKLNEKIKIIKHQDLYINKKDLPIFNSSSIEMNLCNINELSEHFVYLNDDTIIFNKLEVDRFFRNGLPVDFIAHSMIPRKKIYNLIKGKDSWINSINNNINLINKYYSPKKIEKKYLFEKTYSIKNKLNNFLLKHFLFKFIWFEHWHHPQPYNKTTLKDVFSIYKEQMLLCSKNKFRASDDLTHYLYRYYHLVNNKFFPHKYNDGLVKNIDSKDTFYDLLTELKKNNKYNFICFNDSDLLPELDFITVKRELIHFLNNHFQEKSSFEK
ncbi:TPA: Stealth CR1 domain-containing protein [Proteus mirabilis]|nr:Stealth CR1 domain-containing protein [Proteus mirabilis]HEJ9549274.1 Stealth CR1 domain-containing protein [Proteus mirabilis]HEK0591559.1 Stealth CR1 domain-containing protein [Proteus mirabilis]HEK0773448.1 Stealth CR1 domain-containing protein [Proteus mirabilis]HEK2735969.1 Stealth CR1 domain-containing protein [Proteus mirabilis]